MNNNFFNKIVIINVFVVSFVFATFIMIRNTLHNDLKTTILQQKQIDLFLKEVNKVNQNLLLSYNLQDDSYLSKAAVASKEAEKSLTYLKEAGFKIDTVWQLYIEYFKYSVETTSILLEKRLQEARNAYFISDEKHKKLLIQLSQMDQILANEQDKTVYKINLLMFISGTFLIVIMIGNILYLRRSLHLMQKQQDELFKLKIEAVEKEKVMATDRASMIDAIGDGVYGVDEKGYCTFVNHAAIKMLGFKEEQLLNTHQHELFHHHKIDGSFYPEIECPIHQTLVDKQTRQTTEHFINSNGEFIPIALTVAPIGLAGAVVVFKDITELRAQEKRLADQTRLASMGEMIGNIAHQWRQPLSMISTGSTGVLMYKDMGGLTDEILEKTMNNINENAQYLSRTIDDFRDFIKGDRLVREFNLSENINSFLNLVEGAIKSNDIHILKNLDDGINLSGYPNELIQCLINIFNNAKDALKGIDGERYIFVSTFLDHESAVIKIKDNANGIPQDVLVHIFEPYFTTKHQSQGTGLGLSMTYNLITEGMHGDIEAYNVDFVYEDTLYQGAEFVIRLPFEMGS